MVLKAGFRNSSYFLVAYLVDFPEVAVNILILMIIMHADSIADEGGIEDISAEVVPEEKLSTTEVTDGEMTTVTREELATAQREIEAEYAGE